MAIVGAPVDRVAPVTEQTVPVRKLHVVQASTLPTRAKTELIQELTDEERAERGLPPTPSVRGVSGEGKVSSTGEVSGADAKDHYVR